MPEIDTESLIQTSVPPPPTIRELKAAHLRLDRVTKRFGPVVAVDRVSLDIPAGSFTTLLGPSGCGKTTLLRTIAGFYELDAGGIYLDEEEIDERPAHRRGTAMVFQDYALFPHMTVYGNVAYGLKLAKLSKAEVERRTKDTIEFVGLKGYDQRWPNQLSGGQQQRVALARALAVQPRVLLLDEPLSNLDANLRERMRWELRALQQRLEITFVYVTHDQSEALAMSDWIAVMSEGQVVQWGQPWDIYYRPGSVFMAEFLGAANLRHVPVLERTPSALVVGLDGYRLPIPAAGAAAGDQVLLCVRPETLAIHTPPGDPTCINLPGTITRQAFLGHIMRYWVQIGGHEWIVDQSDPGAMAAPFDGPVVLSFNPERVHVIG